VYEAFFFDILERKRGEGMSELIIRNATLSDLNAVTTIEGICFPEGEAATRAAMEERLTIYAKGFFVAELEGEVIGFINGASNDSPIIEDRFYESMKYHQDMGKHLMVYGLDVHPEHQRKGYARELMTRFIVFGREEGKAAVLLTCKAHLVAFYESFGYENLGVSESTHGGAQWHDLKLVL
jgi:ribosomal protein S18 acetylase RimI-like enzyme